jgi:hypothetical protein
MNVKKEEMIVNIVNNIFSRNVRTISRAWWMCVVVLFAIMISGAETATAQNLRRGVKQTVSGGMMQDLPDSLRTKRDTVKLSKSDSLNRLKILAKQARQRQDSISRYYRMRDKAASQGRIDVNGNILPPEPWFGDSVSLSRVCMLSAVLPGYGQIYNKQYWKLPILYGTLGASIGFALQQNNVYKPLKTRYNELIANGLYRTEELNQVQGDMIRSNTKRQLLWGAAIASYIYFLGDAAVNYSTNEVSSVRKATTLSLICPGAGQVYNKSYWRVPIVLGGMASMVYVVDWNNRGFKRFKTAYALRADFDFNPGNYPEGESKDEFRGRYSATYLKNLRDSYRRNRDLCLIMTAALYAFQAVDAHVDAHLKDFDVSDDLSVRLDPMFDYQYSNNYGASPVFGVNLNVTF